MLVRELKTKTAGQWELVLDNYATFSEDLSHMTAPLYLHYNRTFPSYCRRLVLRSYLSVIALFICGEGIREQMFKHELMVGGVKRAIVIILTKWSAIICRFKNTLKMSRMQH